MECPQCGMSFNSEDEMRRHGQTAHQGQGGQQKGQQGGQQGGQGGQQGGQQAGRKQY